MSRTETYKEGSLMPRFRTGLHSHSAAIILGPLDELLFVLRSHLPGHCLLPYRFGMANSIRAGLSLNQERLLHPRLSWKCPDHASLASLVISVD